MPDSPLIPHSQPATISRFTDNGRVYERSIVDCGKANCSRCNSPAGRRPSHGPYWYLCATHGGAWRRVYLGRILDTSRFIAPDGSVDWLAVSNRHSSPTSASPGGNGAAIGAPKSDPPSRVLGASFRETLSKDDYDAWWESRAAAVSALDSGAVPSPCADCSASVVGVSPVLSDLSPNRPRSKSVPTPGDS